MKKVLVAVACFAALPSLIRAQTPPPAPITSEMNGALPEFFKPFFVPAIPPPPPPPPKKSPWADKGEISVVSTNGNSKAETTAIKDLLSYRWSDVTVLEIAGGGMGARNATQVTAENYNASEKVSYKLFDKNFFFERFGWDKDRFAGIESRYDMSVGLGRLLIDKPKDKLIGEMGGGYILQEISGGIHRDFGAGRVYTHYIHMLSPSSNLSQVVEYIHDFSDSRGYRLDTETAAIAALSTFLSLKTSFIWKRNGMPPPGAVKDDTIVSMAVVVNY